MIKNFQRVAIVNRGEPAMRFIHAVAEYNRENGTGIQTIALYTEPDRQGMFVREADETWNLGPATFTDKRDGERKITYLDYKGLERALTETKADAVWAGWGFVAEHAEFVELCDRLGIVFIGPPAEAMRKLGDKISSKILAEKAGVPVAPWSGGAVETLEEARRQAEKLGYPLMLKATAGGGGRGIRKIYDEKDLAESFQSARSEALKAFGDATVFLERMMQGARHVEVQIIGDGYGTVWAVGVRDCTIQRRNQKVLEEAPSPALSAEQECALREAAARLGRELGYQNAGTMEFLFDPLNGQFSFMEVNARLQVEHPVTELTTGLDLVKLQIHVARGGRLEGEPPLTEGCAIEVRLNAEDPGNHFAPAPGKIELFRLPTGPGLRVDTGVAEGDKIPAEFDSMIAKIIAYGHNRQEALSRLKRALSQTAVGIRGGMSNKGFLLELLNHPDVVNSNNDIGWLDRLVKENRHVSRRHADVALMQGAIELYLEALNIEKAKFFASAQRGRPQVREETGITAEIMYQGESYKLKVYRLGVNDFRVDADGQRIKIITDFIGRSEWRLTIAGKIYRVLSMMKGHPHIVEVNGVPHHIKPDQGGVVRAPAPAVVISIPVKEGDEVEVRDRLAVLEAMKMEMPVLADFPGTVKQILVRNNMQVDTGAPLMILEVSGNEKEFQSAGRIDFQALAAPPEGTDDIHRRCEANMEALERLLLGFDADAAEMKRIMEDRGMLCLGMPPEDQPLRFREEKVLSIFADIIALFRREPADDDNLETAGRLSSEEYLFAYLRNISAGEEALPPAFLTKLYRALAHYGVSSLEPSPLLDLTLFRICKSQQRMSRQIGPILSILERRLTHVDTLAPYANEEFRALLFRIISETQGRYPAVNDLAQEVHYRYYDQPLLDRVRDRAYETVEAHLHYLNSHPRALDRGERVRELVHCPQPLKPMLSNWFANASIEMRRIILEVLTRRYYRIRKLENLRSKVIDSHIILSAEYSYQNKRIHLITSHADYENLARLIGAINPLLDKVPPDHDIVIDFYVWKNEAVADRDKLFEEINSILNRNGFSHRIRRIVVSISGPKSSPGMAGVEIFTFRQDEEGFREDKIYRGMHPMMGKRLEIWRLSNFDIERIPSTVEDVYLFKCVAKDNPGDERLFACAEVRDLTVLGREDGGAIQIPNLELMLQESLAGIRRYQSKLPAHKRLHWNRILLYIWPPLDLSPEELQTVIRRWGPATEGIGLEKVVARANMPHPETGQLREIVIEVSNPTGSGLVTRMREPGEQPIRSLSGYAQKVVRLRQRGLTYPYEIISMLAPGSKGSQSEFPHGDFTEYDLNEKNELVPVNRPYGQNKANIIVGVIRNFTERYPEGMARVILLGDPMQGMGSLAEPECRRINAGLELAQKMKVPLEWFAVSAGAKISMESGTENMDWIALVLRRIVEFTQAGGEINIVVTGINVGAQPYWNAEATMLMHTRGILVMMPESAMVLTGKQALDYSGGVSAEDNLGIGGYERIMGPNGQGQYFARNLTDACRILLRHYQHTYVSPGERFPRRANTSDPLDRDVREYPHAIDFDSLGDVFSGEKNPGRKKPFDIRKVMLSAIDQDHPPLERWLGMQDAEIAVIWDAHIGGYPVCLIGFESRPIARLGFVPADGPTQWTGGTLFPMSSKKVARSINAASGNRPLVVLANLSGFDGSPESLRKLQLEYGAEIGRAVVNFKGPIVFCVVSRYHGGAFVVFSNKLNDNMEIAALEGTYASVIGGAPAAAVVFARQVDKRTQMDNRILRLEAEIALAKGAEKARLRSQWNDLYQAVYSEMLGKMAVEFDQVHSVERAQKVGSVNRIIPPGQLRPYLVDALERGMKKELERGKVRSKK